MPLGALLKKIFSDLSRVPDEIMSGRRYALLKRNIILLMVMVTVIPLALMAVIDYHQYRSRLKAEFLGPMRTLASKSRYSFELFMHERMAALGFIAGTNSYGQMLDPETLRRVFAVAQSEYQGLIDMAVLDSRGTVQAYVGPYDKKGRSMAGAQWYEPLRARGKAVSNVLQEQGEVPHLVMAVQGKQPDGAPSASWAICASIDIAPFHDIVASLHLEPGGDVFLVNTKGELQTSSRLYGEALQTVPFTVTAPGPQPQVREVRAPDGDEYYQVSVSCEQPDFVLLLMTRKQQLLGAWNALRSEIGLIFLLSLIVDFAVVYKLTGVLVNRIRQSDQKRELMFREIEHTQKLSSIGRLAAGVAHEINNPLAIINEKAGLLKDLVQMTEEMPRRDKFLKLSDSILGSVVRCRTITHRLLGFARRMEVQVEELEVNEVVREVLGFLDKEALYRKIDIELTLHDKLPRVVTDRGQIQQVFLNILNNAMQAVDDGGSIAVATDLRKDGRVAISIADNGIGMSEETLKHIFEPFFSTKGNKGTGLGLSITYGIVNKLGGELQVQSVEGKGTTFTVLLPRILESAKTE